MSLTEKEVTFLQANRGAAMTTLRRDGTPRIARVGVGLVDGKLWSSGTRDRLRTKHLRRDPRSTLFVFDAAYAYLTLESVVTILDGQDVPELNMKLFRVMQDKPSGPLGWFGADREPDEFLQVMRDEGRLIYEFDVRRFYGLY